MRFRKSILSLIVILLFSESCALAGVYPWVWMHKDDLRLIPDPKVEAEFRIELIRMAQKTIDIVTYDQRADDQVGKPFLHALREAADRGVKIRFLTSWSGHVLKDPFNYSGKYLLDSPTRIPIQFIIVGGPPMWARGWGYLDGIHEKMFIVDGLRVLITGRGQADQYLEWMDTGLIFKGKLVQQSIRAFEFLWKTVQRENGTDEQGSIGKGNVLPASGSSGEVRVSKKGRSSEKAREVDSLVEWVKSSPLKFKKSEMNHSVRVRLIHNNFLNQLRRFSDKSGRTPNDFSYEERLSIVSDPIIQEIIDLMSNSTAQDMKFFILSVILNPRFKHSLIQNLKKGLKVQIFTNGVEAHRNVVPIHFPIGWYVGISDLDDLLQSGARGIALKKKYQDSAVFLHRKIAKIDDSVIIGSHNFNLASSVESDELVVEIQGPSFSQEIEKLFKTSVDHNGVVIDPELLHYERQTTLFNQWWCRAFSTIY